MPKERPKGHPKKLVLDFETVRSLESVRGGYMMENGRFLGAKPLGDPNLSSFAKNWV